jgi:integrase
MSSIGAYALSDGARRYRVYYRDPSHKSKEKSGFRRKKDAEDWMARNVTTAISDGAYVDPLGARTRIEKLGEEWIEGHRSVWKPSYLHSVKTSWKVHVNPKWGDRTLGGIKHTEVQSWVSKMAKDGKSASVVYRAFGILKGIYDNAVKDRLINRVPTQDINLPAKVKKPHLYLTVDQVLNLADKCGRYRTLILTLGFCGLRWGEATGLRISDLNFKRGRITISKSATYVGGSIELGTPKNNKVREVPMPRIVRLALLKEIEGRKPDDLVFTDENGGYVRQQSVGKGHRGWFRKGLEEAGLPLLKPHDLRHTAASVAVSSGASVKVVQRMLGHSSAAMTLDTYSDLFDTDLDDVALNIDALIQGK